MGKLSNREVTLEIPLYGLPSGTDLVNLARLACGVAEALELMGVFGHREFEPTYVFRVPEGKKR